MYCLYLTAQFVFSKLDFGIKPDHGANPFNSLNKQQFV